MNADGKNVKIKTERFSVLYLKGRKNYVKIKIAENVAAQRGRMKYAIAMVDDEKEQTEITSEYIRRYFEENGGEYTLSVFYDGADFIKDYSPIYDIVFLDIEMNRRNGYDTAKIIRKTDESTAIVFVTRLARYALKGYEVSALDFIVKPMKYPSFAQKMKRFLAYVDGNRKKIVSVNGENGAVYFDENEISYVEVVSHYLIYHTVRGDFREWGTLKDLSKRLSEDKFKMCNRCYIVNLRYVRGIKDNIVTVGDNELIISRYKRKDFIEAVASFWGERG